MPKYRARVDCYLNPITDAISVSSRAAGEYFVNLVQHVSSSGADLGIEMIAANYGVGGTGFNFWDEANNVGVRSWACFRFHSASLGKFDCLIFQLTGSNNASYGPPVAINGLSALPGALVNTNNLYLGISFASHPSGSNVAQSDGPWNGDYSLTSGTIGSPMWKVTPEGKGAFFPRNNGILGTYSGSRGYMTPILSLDGNAIPPMRQHIIVSEDSLTLLHDRLNDGNTRVVHFGSFLPRSGTQQDSPYLMFVNLGEPAVPIPGIYQSGAPTAIGQFGNNSSNQVTNGAVSHPNLLSGSKQFIFSTIPIDQSVGYNRFVNSGSFEKIPLWAHIYESPNFYGILGVMNHIYYGKGMNNRTVSELSSSVAFGESNLNEEKIIVPWDGAPPNTSPTVRTGRSFSIG